MEHRGTIALKTPRLTLRRFTEADIDPAFIRIRRRKVKVIDVYRQYFAAECEYNNVARRGALVALTATSDAGEVKYEAAVSFFPHGEEDDFAVSYDAYAVKELYSGKGRRSKKREKEYLEKFREYADEAAASIGGAILWDKPLREAQMG